MAGVTDRDNRRDHIVIVSHSNVAVSADDGCTQFTVTQSFCTFVCYILFAKDFF